MRTKKNGGKAGASEENNLEARYPDELALLLAVSSCASLFPHFQLCSYVRRRDGF